MCAEYLGANSKPKIDGILDDAAWVDTEHIGDFHQTRPNDKGEVSEKTEVYIVRSDELIYIAFKVHDSKIDKLGAKGLIQGQSIDSGDSVSVGFDTFNDKRNSFFAG